MSENIPFTRERILWLESKLAQIEALAIKRQSAKTAAEVKAMEAWLENPALLRGAYIYHDIFTVIPDDRFTAGMTKLYQAYGTDEAAAASILATLQSLPVARQKKLQSFICASYGKFLDHAEERECQLALVALYKELLTKCPRLLENAADRRGHARLTDIFCAAAARNLQWEAKQPKEKIDLLKSWLAQSYVDDDLDNLQLTIVHTNLFSAAWYSEFHAIVFSPASLAEITGRGIAILAHEYQHRRQFLMVEKLERNELEKGSVEYFQARLFRVNLFAGYLQANPSYDARIPHRFDNYRKQPVEIQANNHMDSVRTNVDARLNPMGPPC